MGSDSSEYAVPSHWVGTKLWRGYGAHGCGDARVGDARDDVTVDQLVALPAHLVAVGEVAVDAGGDRDGLGLDGEGGGAVPVAAGVTVAAGTPPVTSS